MALIYLACTQTIFCFSLFALYSQFLMYFVLLFLVTIEMTGESFIIIKERSRSYRSFFKDLTAFYNNFCFL